MNELMGWLCFAFLTGVTHAILGPDHYVPIIALAKAQRLNLRKVMGLTMLCALSHVMFAMVIGQALLAMKFSFFRWEVFESLRGDVAAWVLIVTGVVYLIWALRKEIVATQAEDLQVKGQALKVALIVFFVVGPCEPLIPILSLPDWTHFPSMKWMVVGAFGLSTMVTMIGLVATGLWGMNYLRMPKFQATRWPQALAAMTFIILGMGMKYLGW